jgi:hypothetical protein
MLCAGDTRDVDARLQRAIRCQRFVCCAAFVGAAALVTYVAVALIRVNRRVSALEGRDTAGLDELDDGLKRAVWSDRARAIDARALCAAQNSLSARIEARRHPAQGAE